eukprot:11160726-Lingulodinium_polyedra.AAC.1
MNDLCYTEQERRRRWKEYENRADLDHFRDNGGPVDDKPRQAMPFEDFIIGQSRASHEQTI